MQSKKKICLWFILKSFQRYSQSIATSDQLITCSQLTILFYEFGIFPYTLKTFKLRFGDLGG
jgi:hypothetical protein